LTGDPVGIACWRRYRLLAPPARPTPLFISGMFTRFVRDIMVRVKAHEI